MINMLNIKEAILELFNEEELISKEDYNSAIQDAIDYINSDINLTPSEPVVVPPPTITLTVSDDILSYSDNDSTVCTVTAIGETNGYSIQWYKNNTYLTTTTFSNNTTSYTYNSQGEGNVTIRAELVKENNVISTQSDNIIDYILYDPMTSDSSHWTYQSTTSHSYSSNGAYISGSAWSDNGVICDAVLNSPYIIEWNVNQINSTIYVDFDNSGTVLYFQSDGRATLGGTHYQGKGGTGKYALKILSDTIEFYKNDEYVGNMSVNVLGDEFLFLFGSGCNFTVKNIIIKPIPQFDVTTNKNILSYSDNDTSTLTATYTHTDTSDYTVEWYNGSTLLGSSNFTGDTASYVYESTGVGDVEITAKVVDTNESVIITDSIVLEDCWKYDTSVHSTSDEVVNWDLPNGDFEVSAYIERGTGGAYIDIGGGTTSDRVLFGHCATSPDFHLVCGNNTYNNGSGNNLTHTLKIINDIAYYTVNGNTVNGNIPVSLTRKLSRFAPWGNSKISNIKIKLIPSVDVSTTKNILSYIDTDNTTLTATVDGSIYDSVVKWYNGNTLLSTSQLTSNTVTYTYNSGGSGDVTIRAELVRDNNIISSDTVSLEDCQFYDNALTDNTSQYDLTYNTGQTFTYDSTNSAYQVTRTSNGFGSILVDDLLMDNGTPLEISTDILLKTIYTSSGGYNTQPRLIIVGESNHTGIGADLSGYYHPQFEISIRELTVNSDVSMLANQQYNMSTNTWYTMKMTYNNNSIIITLYDNQGTQLATSSSTYTVTGDYQCGIQMVHDTGASILFKNLKIKTIGE